MSEQRKLDPLEGLPPDKLEAALQRLKTEKQRRREALIAAGKLIVLSVTSIVSRGYSKQSGDLKAVKDRVLAEHLVKQGKLSRFQARKLMQGSYRGLVLGPFQVLAPIGRGGMGAVYLARDHRSGKLLALKVLPPERARAEERILATTVNADGSVLRSFKMPIHPISQDSTVRGSSNGQGLK